VGGHCSRSGPTWQSHTANSPRGLCNTARWLEHPIPQPTENPTTPEIKKPYLLPPILPCTLPKRWHCGRHHPSGKSLSTFLGPLHCKPNAESRSHVAAQGGRALQPVRSTRSGPHCEQPARALQHRKGGWNIPRPSRRKTRPHRSCMPGVGREVE